MDDSIRTMEDNLRAAHGGDYEKTDYMTHYLAGSDRAWWETDRALLPQIEVVTWDAYKDKFLKRYVSSGLVSIMREKFLQLKQGGMSMNEYLEKFTTLARYAPSEMDTEDKKKERFLNGLHDELQCVLVVMPFTDLESLADAAIMMEHKRKSSFENRKHRQMMHTGSSSNGSGSSNDSNQHATNTPIHAYFSATVFCLPTVSTPIVCTPPRLHTLSHCPTPRRRP